MSAFRSTTRPDDATPFSIIHGRPFNAAIDAKYQWGSLQYVSGRETDNTMTPRVTACIAIGQIHNGTGTGMFYSLASGHILKANHSTAMPFSQEVIQFLNALAAKDQRVSSREPLFQFHGQEMSDCPPGDHPTQTDPDQGELQEDPQGQDFPALPDQEETEDTSSPYDQQQPLAAPSPEAEAPYRAESLQEPLLQALPTNFRGETTPGEDPSLPIHDEEPVQENNLDDIYPPQGDNVPGVLPRPWRPPKTPTPTTTPTRPRPVAVQDPRSNAETHEDSPSIHRYPSRTRSAPTRLNLTCIADKIATLSVMHVTAKRAMRDDPEQSEPAIMQELQNLTDKLVLRGVHTENLTPGQRSRILRSQMNVTKKVTPSSDGSGRTLDRVKARLVAGGDGQDRNHYSRSETTSPTASTSGLAITLMLAAATGCHCVTADIGCAYLNATMPKNDPDKLVFIRIPPHIAAMLVKVDPKMRKYLRTDGSLVAELDRALYGCVESAQLWFKEITSCLTALGFRPNVTDPCILNMKVKGVMITIVIYVDDLLFVCTDLSIVHRVIAALRRRYGEVKTVEGLVHHYLGVVIDFTDSPLITLNQTGMIEDIVATTRSAALKAGIDGSKVPHKTGSRIHPKTPAAGYLFSVTEDKEPISDELKAIFHTAVAKVLFLANRTRPDVLTAVSFLTKRVLYPTAEDWEKLSRLLSYLEATKDLKQRLGATLPLRIRTYVDASFAVHPDMKSHTGVCISLGTGCFYAKSTGQKINTTSSCQAELVAVSKGMQQSIFASYLIEGQGYPRPLVTVFQDNQSAIKLIENGRSNSELTRHIEIGYYWIKNLVDRGLIEVIYCPTGEMIADLFTKPLQGTLFEYMRGKVLGVSPLAFPLITPEN